MIAIVAGRRPAAPSPLAFTGQMPDPALSGLYRYSDHVDEPSIGRRLTQSPAEGETFASTDAIATWLATTPHSRPFWRDSDFVAEFGRVTRAELRAAVTEMWRRAEDAARAARMPIAWTADLSTPDIERNAA